MGMIFVLLKKEFIILKSKSLKLFFFSILFPLLLYLFFSIPLSLVFDNVKPIYLIWSSPGISVVSTLFLLLIVLVPHLLDKFNSEFLYTTPVSFNNIILSVFSISIILSFIQFLFSTFTINLLNNNFTSFTDLIIMYLIFLPSIVIVINLSLIISCIVKDKIIINFINLLFFVSIAFGFGAFFPLEYFPKPFSEIFIYFPISASIINMQKIIAADSIYFSYLIVSFIYMLFFTLISVFVAYYNIKNRLY